jgi:hypothetical protein
MYRKHIGIHMHIYTLELALALALEVVIVVAHVKAPVPLVVAVALVLVVELRHGKSRAPKHTVKVPCKDRKPSKTHDSERLKTRNLCKINGKRANARVHHALPYGVMPSRLAM